MSTARWRAMVQRSRRVRGDSGATVVEFALSAAIVFMMLFGIMEMCLAFYTYNFVSEAARETARYAIVRGSTSCTNTPNLTNCNATAAEINSYINDFAYPALSSSNLTVATSWLTATTSGSPATTTWTACSTGVCNAPKNMVKVVMTYDFPVGIPYVPKSTLAITSTSEMVIQQ
jgi:Flp pilus assembly protein TadG